MAAKKKAKPTMDRATDRLYKAVENYVTKKGGKLVVIGGIQVQQWPADPAMVFYVAIKCMGRMPEYVEGNSK